EPTEVRRLSQIVQDIPNNKIYSSVLDPTTGLVCAYTSKERGYHITLCPGTSQNDIYKYVEAGFARGNVVLENPSVEIQNATGLPGLAYAAAEQLTALNVKATSTNAPNKTNPARTIVYDLTGGQK